MVNSLREVTFLSQHSLYINERVAQEAIAIIGAGRKWIGIHDKQVEGTFKYASTGLSLAFTPVWQANNPSNGGGVEDCIDFGSNGQKWNDISCEVKLLSVCESK